MSTQDAVKKAGLKATLPRMLILEVLTKTIDSEIHLSAEDIYKDLLTSGDDVGLATVYRVLSQFESAGIVTRHNFEEGHSVYEMTKITITIIWFALILEKLSSFMIQKLKTSRMKLLLVMGMKL